MDVKEYTYFFIALFYFSLCIICFCLLLIIWLNRKVKELTTQKLFLILLFVTSLFRTVFFVFIPFFDADTDFLGHFSLTVFTILDDLGDLAIFSTFCILILFWYSPLSPLLKVLFLFTSIFRLEVIYYATSRQRLFKQVVKVSFILGNMVVYIIQIILWLIVCFFFSRSQILSYLSFVDNLFYAFLCFCTAIGLSVCGGKLYKMLKSNPLHSQGKRAKMAEVLSITIICSTLFALRSLLMIYMCFNFKLTWKPAFVSAYYISFDILPLSVVLYILRKLPPKRPDINSIRSSINQPLVSP